MASGETEPRFVRFADVRTSANRTAHPRVCGDGPWQPSDGRRLRGSPPRVRGRPRPIPALTANGGLTPACAGTAGGVEDTAKGAGAHPRVCGDGAQDRHLPQRLDGLTPACAGTASRIWSRTWPPRAHPRVCGDGVARYASGERQVGSPPRVRGRRLDLDALHAHQGLTPACAGTAHAGGRRPCGGRAHPRVCGDCQWPVGLPCGRSRDLLVDGHVMSLLVAS